MTRTRSRVCCWRARRPETIFGVTAPSGSQVLVERVRLRFGWSILGANMFGALTVFVLLVFVLPGPKIKHPDTVKLISAIAFVVGGAALFLFAWTWSARTYRATLNWAIEGRAPTDAERDRMLRFPLTQQKIAGAVWVISAVVYAGITLPFSLELSS